MHRARTPRLSPPPVPRPSPRGPPAALPSRLLRRPSSPSQSRAMPLSIEGVSRGGLADHLVRLEQERCYARDGVLHDLTPCSLRLAQGATDHVNRRISAHRLHRLRCFPARSTRSSRMSDSWV